MGLTLMARLASCTTCGLSAELRQHYAAEAGRMQLQFTSYLRDPVDGLIYHGARAAGAGGPAARQGQPAIQHSCCKWGRANGWGLLSHVEVLLALDAVGDVGIDPVLKVRWCSWSRVVQSTQGI